MTIAINWRTQQFFYSQEMNNEIYHSNCKIGGMDNSVMIRGRVEEGIDGDKW